jgi:hypothetical protein
MRSWVIAAATVFVLALPWFSRTIGTSDHSLHISIAFDILHGKWPPHPLYHLLLLALTGCNKAAAPGVAAVLLAMALSARAYLTATALTESGLKSAWSVTALCLALALAIVLPNWWERDQIVGQPSPNLWHNPTFIFAMPFCLAAFLSGMRLLETPSLRLGAVTGLWLALSLLAKPNYALAFLPCFGPAVLLALWRTIRDRKLDVKTSAAVALTTFVPAAVVLVFQFVWSRGNAVFAFLPLGPWMRHTPSIPLSVLVGTVFPLAVLLCYPLQANDDRSLIMAWGTLGIAIAMAASLSEDVSSLEFNWGWGLHFADAVLFVATAAFLVRQRGRWRRWACFGVLGIHVVAGVIYLVKY